MNNGPIMGLVYNAVLLLVLNLLYDTLPIQKRTGDWVRKMFTGIALGLIGIAIMLTPWRYSAGVALDTSSILLSLSGLYFGFIPTLITFIFTCLLRIYQGGSAVAMGSALLLTSGALGLGWRYYLHQGKKIPTWNTMIGFGVVVHLGILLGVLLLPQQVRPEVIRTIWLPGLVIYPIVTLLLGLLLTRQRQQAELRHELRHQRDHVDQITETSLDAILLSGPDGCILAANPAACGMFACSQAEIIQSRLADLVDMTDPRLPLSMQKNIWTGSFIGELFFIRKNGQKFPGEVSIAVFVDQEGDHRTSMIIRDITERKKAEAQLLLQGTALNAAANAIIITNKDGIIEWHNPAFSELSGFSWYESIGKNPRELIRSGKHDQPFYADLWNTILSGQVWVGELVNRHKDGHLYIEQETITPLKDANGNISHFIAIKQDISARRQAENALTASETRLRAVVEQVPAIVYTESAEARNTLYISPQLEKLTGYLPEEWIMDRDLWKKVIHPDDLAAVLAEDEATTDSYKPFNIEYRLLTRNGRTLWVHDEAVIIQSQDGTPMLWNGVMYDITQRKQAEEAQRASETKYRNHFENVVDVIYSLDRQFQFIDVSPSVERIMGYTPQEMIGRKFLDLHILAPEYLRTALSDVRKMLAGQRVSSEYGFIAKNGTRVLGEITGSPLKDTEGRVIGVLAVARDITERKQAEQAFQESQNRYRSLFEDSAIPLWVEDFSLVRLFFDRVSASGVQDWRDYFETHPEAVSECAGLIQILDINKPGLKYYQMESKEEIIPMLPAYFVEDSWPVFKEEMIALAEGRMHFESEIPIRSINGEYRQLFLTLSIAPEHQHSLSRVLISFLDITERMQAEKALQESQNRYRSLFEDSAIPLWEEDFSLVHAYFERARAAGVQDWRLFFDEHPEAVDECVHLVKILEVNKAGVNFYRVANSGEKEVQLPNSFVEESWIVFKEEMIALAQGQTRFESVIPVRGANGGKRYLIMTLSIAPEHIKTLTRVLISFIDITARTQAEQALRASEEQNRRLINMLPSGVIVHSQGEIRLVNRAAMKLLGATEPEQLIGMDILERVQPDARELVREGIRQSHEQGKELDHVEDKLLRLDGSPFESEGATISLHYADKLSTLYVFNDITERKHRENELVAIAQLSAALRTAQNRTDMLPEIGNQLFNLLECDSASIEIIEAQSGEVIIEVAQGGWAPFIGLRQSINTGMNAVITKTMQPYHTSNVENDSNRLHPMMVYSGINSMLGVPLLAQEKLIGFIWVGRKTDFVESETRLLVAIADISANAIHRTSLHERTQADAANLARAYDKTLEGWAHALELRDQETEGHTRRVAKMTLDLARAVGIAEDQLEDIRRGALLHDIGKMGIPDSVLLKAGTLNEREWEIMRRHPEYAYNMLMPIDYLQPAVDIPYCHHEKWDGSGYPRGLKGEEIPYIARIFAIVDVWDAITSDRPYRLAWSKAKAQAYIQQQSGTHFDPQVVAAFFTIVDL